MKPRTKKITYIVSGTILGLLLLTVVTILALPSMIRWGAESWLRDQGMEARIEAVELDLGEGLLAVKNARGAAADGSGFEFAEISIRWLWHTLTDKRFVITAVELRDVSSGVEITKDGQMKIAGLVLPTGEAGSAPPEEPREPSEWQIEVGRVALWNTKLCYRDEVQLANADTPLPHFADLCATWNSIVWFGETLLGPESSRPGGPLPLSVNGELIIDDLQVSNRDASQRYFQLEKLVAAGIDLRDMKQLAVGEMTSEGVIAAYFEDPEAAPAWLSFNNLQAKGLTLQEFDRLALEMMEVNGFTLQQHQGSNQGRALARFDGLSLETVAIESLKTESPISLAAISVEQLQVMERPEVGENEAGHIAQLNALLLEELALPDRQTIEIGKLDLRAPQIWLARNKEGAWEVLEWLGNGETTEEPQPVEEKASLRFVVGELNLRDAGQITMDDQGVSPAYRESVKEIELSVGGLDNQSPESDSPVKLAASMGKYGKIAFDGTMRPFSARPHMTLKGTISGIDVGPLTGYARDLVQHHIKQGSLDANVDMKIETGVMDSVVELELHKLQMEPIPESEKKNEASQELGIPLNAALSLLRDKDDGIRLTLPIAGDIGSPEVSLQSIMGKVMGKAIKTAIVAYYSPFGLLKLAGAVLDLATGLSFEPVEFEVGSAELIAAQRDHLGEITKLLQERPQVRLSLCGDLTEADFEQLFPPPPPPAPKEGEKKQAEEEKAPVEEPEKPAEETKRVPTPEQMEGLVALAAKRGEAVKDFLISQGGIEAKRLILCNPTPELKAEGAALVTISI